MAGINYSVSYILTKLQYNNSNIFRPRGTYILKWLWLFQVIKLFNEKENVNWCTNLIPSWMHLFSHFINCEGSSLRNSLNQVLLSDSWWNILLIFWQHSYWISWWGNFSPSHPSPPPPQSILPPKFSICFPNDEYNLPRSKLDLL